MTKEEYAELFKMDENGCYVNLIIPPLGEFPEMNLIGKLPQDYTMQEVVHVKAYSRSLFEKLED